MEREVMEFDVVIIGAGPSGLATACHLAQLAQKTNKTVSICVVEKGSEVGAHILSGAVMEPQALKELFPNWEDLQAPANTPVTEDSIYYFRNDKQASKIPPFFVPKATHNKGNYIISLANLCRWLAEQAEGMGVDIFPGFAAAELLYHKDGCIKGVITGDMGVASNGEQKPSFQAGYQLHGKYTVLAEGCRGHLGKQVIKQFGLDKDSGTQHYGIGIKEIWDITPEKHQAGKVLHSIGWPLLKGVSGGGFLYHLENNQVAVGLIIDLNYNNPYLSPFDEFQRYKHHPLIKSVLEDGKRVAYGARALCKGGFQAVPKLSFPGGLLVGDDAGLLNFLKIKGNHSAIKSGILAAETLFEALQANTKTETTLSNYDKKYRQSWLYKELYQSRNTGPAMHKFGMLLGSAFTFIDQCIFRGKLPFTFSDPKPDHSCLKPANQCEQIKYPKADNKISFDKLSSVYLSNTNHEENQPCHLQLKDQSIPIKENLPRYAEPAQRYCPAGVYEIVENQQGEASFQINSQNCVHCKTCDIKDPAQNINWLTPEGAGGPNYPNM